MLEVFEDALLDALKLLPYLLITFLLLEFIEHKLNNKNKKVLSKANKVGPLVGGILGAAPQCGFSSMAANLFSCRVITMGTLIAVFLSTSDEMIPIMIGEKINVILIFYIVLFKIFVGIIIGFIVDLIFRKNKDNKNEIHELCDKDHCDCDHDGIIMASIKHTLKTAFFVLVFNIIINLIIFYIGEDKVSGLLQNKNILTYFISSLIGLVPNCAGSIIISELYISGFITLGMLLSGLLTGSGIGILLLYKENKNIKQNLLITSIIYFVGVIIGILVDLIV